MFTAIPTALVIKNSEFEKVQFPPNLLDFLGRRNWRLADVLIPKLNAPCVYFVYCDLVDPARNLINGKKSNLLAMFDIRKGSLSSNGRKTRLS